MRAFVWFSSAAARGDAKAKVALRAVSRTMTREEVSQAREMAQAPTLVRARRAKHEHAASPRQPAQCRPKLLIQALIGDQPLLRTGLAAGHGASYSPSP